MLRLFLEASVALLLVISGSFAIGWRLARTFSSSFTNIDRIAVGLLGGFGLFSLAFFLVGQVYFTRMSIAILLGLFIITGLPVIWKFVTGNVRNWKESIICAPRIPLLLVGSVLLLTAVSGLDEITGNWRNDTVEYHLLGPKVWLREGVIRPVADNCHTAFPQTAETVFAVLLAVGGPRAPGFSSFVTLGMLLLIAASLAIRSGLNVREVWWVAAIVATTPAIYTGSIGCFIDGFYAALILAAIRIGIDAQTRSEWIAFGVICGVALGTKYTAILAVPIVVIGIAVSRMFLKRSVPQQRWTSIAAAAGVGFLIAAPYYLRNWIILGCPIYPPPPGLANLCSPKYLSFEAIAQFHAYIRERGAGLGRGLSAFLLLPLNLTYHTSNFHGAGGIGLVPLALGPIGVVRARKETVVKTLSVIGFLLLVVWFITQQESRFLIHVYVLAIIFGVMGWRNMSASGKKSARMLAVVSVLLSIGYGLFMMSEGWIGSVRAALSPSFAKQVRAENVPYLESFQFINSSAEVKRVLILDRSVMPFYSDKSYVKPAGWWAERTLPGAPSPAEALQEVRTLSVSHVLDVRSEFSGFQVEPETTGLTLVFEAQDQRVYRVD